MFGRRSGGGQPHFGGHTPRPNPGQEDPLSPTEAEKPSDRSGGGKKRSDITPTGDPVNKNLTD